MEKITQLIRGECPICKKIIMDKTKTKYVNGGIAFWVKFSDGSQAQFSACEDCYKVITQEQLDDIMASQKVNWGWEISKTLQWYYDKAIHLKIAKHAKEKDGLQT